MKSISAFLAIQQCSAYIAPQLSAVRVSQPTRTKHLHSTAESTFEGLNNRNAVPLDQFSSLPTEATEPLFPSDNLLAGTPLSEVPTPAIETPSVRKILSYTLPAIGVWMCSPILSMIDTAAVGMLSGTAQQAALNPAVSVTDYGALVVVSFHAF
jgi:hypothetical protein